MEKYVFIMVFYAFQSRTWKFIFLTSQGIPHLVLSDLSNW